MSLKGIFAVILILPLAALACGGGDSYTDDMAQEHEGDTPAASAAVEETSDDAPAGGPVEYAVVGGDPASGFLALPEGGGAGKPGVILIHEWWGLNDNIRSMARQLAEQGYAALAVDLYGGTVAENPEDARTAMQAAMEDQESARENLRGAVDYLKEEVGATQIGSIGWCFGGYWSLQAAIEAPEEVDAAVIYYGRPESDPARLAQVQGAVLGHYGELDEGIPLDAVREMEAALEEAGKDFTMHVYEGADHAFANPSGTRYDEEAAKAAWDRTLAFFAEHLSGEAATDGEAASDEDPISNGEGS